jgi:tRNA(Arg) A34 adenosine deaminase TadA
VGAAAEAYGSLDEAWRVAIDEAWRSWCAGSAGVGAVITDGEQRIVAVGRNRIAEPRSEPGVLAWTTLAHAEMNALAVLDLGADARTITTTFEPCLMCAATILQTGIPQVRYASGDPYFDGLGDWFATLDVPGKPAPASTELGGSAPRTSGWPGRSWRMSTCGRWPPRTEASSTRSSACGRRCASSPADLSSMGQPRADPSTTDAVRTSARAATAASSWSSVT